MSLKARLAREIALTGPLSVADYVVRCLHDPQDGYYATRPRLGAEGDFITAPLVSQMFGELIGLWMAEVWRGLGAPDRFRLVEVGPGDGTLMLDLLRAARAARGFIDAAELVLIEPSRPLRAVQARRLAESPLEPHWVETLAALPADAPVLLVANEVLDCLPARQFVKTAGGWAERRVGLTEAGELTFGLSAPTGGLVETTAEVGEGQVLEVSDLQAAFGRDLGDLVARAGGAALLIDYGRARPEAGDTLQALVRHRKVDPLEGPGEADLTQWADFPTVLEAAVRAGADVTGCLGQGDFLRALGIEIRADRLRAARPEAAAVVDRQLARLTAPEQMGELFKACAVFSPRSLPLPGFET